VAKTSGQTQRTLLVAKYELVSTLRRRSFWFMALVFPAVIIIFATMSQVVAQRSTSNGGGSDDTPAPAFGYVDLGGLVTTLPPEIDPTWMRSYPDRPAADAALAADEISHYYVIPAGAVESGDITRVEPELRPLSALGVEPIMRYAVAYNLLPDKRVALVYLDPTPDPATVSLGTADSGGDESSETMQQPNPVVPYAVVFVMFFVITTTGGFMLQSVSREKESRTAEILLLSMRPRRIMLGKLLGLTTVALVQMGFWAGAVVLALDQARDTFDLAIPKGLPATSYVAGFLFFLLGYIMYSSALGALGAVAPNSREGGQFTMVILLPLFAPLFLNSVVAMAPNGTVSVVMSLFPLTAPVGMPARLVMTTVPWWHITIGLVGVLLTTYALVALSARFFRADTLLSSSPLSLARIRSGLMGRPSR
jgi:ABC-2 type transport system permease protein